MVMEKRLTISLVMAMPLISVSPFGAFAQTNESNVNTNSQGTVASEDDNNFLTYENATLGISIQYPSDWTIIEEYHGVSSVRFIPPPSENDSDTSSAGVNLFIADVPLFPSSSPGGLSLDNYTVSTIHFLTTSNSSISELTPTSLRIGNDNHTAYKLVSSSQGGEEDQIMQQMQIYTITDSKLYSIDYVAEASKYLVYLPRVERMVDSFTAIMDDEESKEVAR
jgi:hypothetical protein